MRFYLPILLSIFSTIMLADENLILYFGIHKEPLSKTIAGSLNSLTDGIALHIPVLYLKRTALAISVVSALIIIYRYRKVFLNLNEPIPQCLCDMCLDSLQDDA